MNRFSLSSTATFYFYYPVEGARYQVLEKWPSIWGSADARHLCPRYATLAHASPWPGVYLQVFTERGCWPGLASIDYFLKTRPHVRAAPPPHQWIFKENGEGRSDAGPHTYGRPRCGYLAGHCRSGAAPLGDTLPHASNLTTFF